MGAPMRFVSKVREHRERRGISAERLAREVRVTRQTIENIERGIHEPRVMLALAIADELEVAVTDLFRPMT